MALDNSSDAYVQLYNSSESENSYKYYDGYVEMKGKFKWSQYYCELKKHNLYFFKDSNTQIKDNYVGYFALEVPTNIEMKGTREWIMKTKTKKIALRTQSEDNRKCWIDSFQKSMNGEPPSTGSYILPGSGPASPPNSPVKHQLSQTSPPQSPPADFQNTSLDHRPSRKVSSGSVRYTMTDEQVARLNQHAQAIAENVTMTDDEIRIQDQLLGEDKSWYQASFRREDVQRILQNEKNGVFIVRDYIDVATSRNMGFVISLKDQGGEIRHHKIQKTPDGLVIKGYEGKLFDTLHNLLRFYIASQRKRVVLVPYVYRPAQEAKQVDEPSSGYEDMGAPPQFSPPPLPPSKGARSRSFNDRGLPPIPPAPSQGMARADRFNPRGLIDSRGYENMDSPVADRLNDQESYEVMDSPMKNRNLPPIPSEFEPPISPPMSPNDTSSYVNLDPPPSCFSSYQNIEPNPYINTPAGYGHFPEEPAPALPPKRRAASMRESGYVNLPGRDDRPPRPPLRKAHTIGR